MFSTDDPTNPISHAMPEDLRILPDRMHRLCDPSTLGFATTAELEVPDTLVLGQDDAVSALSFGLSLTDPGYNVFVLGTPGSGRLSFARRLASERAGREDAPSDWCYVFNFDDPRRPRALELPTGRGPELRDTVSEVVDELRSVIPDALDSDEVSERRAAIIEEHGKRAGNVMEGVRRELEDDPWVALVGPPGAMTVVGARGGEPLSRAAYDDLSDEDRATVDERVLHATGRVFDTQRRIHQVHQEARDEVAEFHHDVARQLVTGRMESLRERFRGVESALEHIDRMADDMIRHVDAFIAPSSLPPGLLALADDGPPEMGGSDALGRYEVNPVVTHRVDGGAPVVEEHNPHLRNLFGRIEGQMRFGVMMTDFTRIASGSAHRALGGYLLVRAEELLTRPLAWPALKRTLRTGELVPVDPMTETGLIAMQSLEPEPIPANLTVILVGEPRTFYVLQQLDPEFDEVFKVKVDFESDMDRDQAAERKYAELVAAECRRKSLPPFDAEAVGRIIEEGSRLADDQTKLTTRIRPVLDLVLESAYHGEAAGPVTVEDVEAALAHQDLRRRRPERRMLELVERGVLAFDPKGEEVGQLYGIGLTWMGDSAVGRPIRVMASAYLGQGGLIDIEREAELAGRIHNKGFLVVSGYLGRRFAGRKPLTLSATLSFDQLYEEVEGDSASAAELYALFSAIGRIPIRQGIAVTGAVNQEGMVLPVGGVTPKVEGFFKACQRRGMDDGQGVILPRRNLENLCLGKDVRDAVEQGRFHVWAIERVEEGWPVLAGLEAGVEGDDGTYPEGTVHREVQDRLAEWSEEWARTRKPSDAPGEDH